MMDVNGTGPTRHDREPGPHRPMRHSKPTTPGRPVGSGRVDAGGPFARLPLLLVEEHRVGIGRCVAGVRLSLRLTAFDSGGELPFRLPWPTPVNKGVPLVWERKTRGRWSRRRRRNTQGEKGRGGLFCPGLGQFSLDFGPSRPSSPCSRAERRVVQLLSSRTRSSGGGPQA
ncbi:hypothetical protein CPLU01_02038 [Colletotrichum plurivorum]|uniref:Uncharacterized protein n=1 Tax=Colletotrichum plurivorum TaxID=2175906 RepID=A0A8H6KWN1_9PEZI|nr:hypothetical protein CPLU01_02038 [Colletotrichum plurivorum]